ncbi:MAG TPA: chromosome partitioning protein [Holosporales bacterium]|nr:chromosome partitioning protein [Holosporales bacterium]
MPKLTNTLDICINNGKRVFDVIKETNFTPDQIKRLHRVFTLAETAQLVGVSTEAIRKAEIAGKISKAETDEKSKRRMFTLKKINECRDYFGTRPGRKDGDHPTTVAFINFKGGVYKSTASLHFAQYLALAGYKVLFVDTDSQATSTQFFGIIPDNMEQELSTIASFLIGEASSLSGSIINTYWEGLDLIPANLGLYDAEILVPIKVTQGALNKNFYSLLREGLETVKHAYDIVVIDAPPSLGIISMNVIYAADGLVIPIPPLFADFSSTLEFFSMLREVAENLGDREFKFLKLLITKFDGSEESKTFVKVIKQVFGGDLVMSNIFSNTAEIPRASQDLKTVYEVTDVKVKQTYLRAIGILDRVNKELERTVLSTWPSYAKNLVTEGVF